VSRRISYASLAALCALPRLGVLLHERGSITASYTEKSDTFALTFVQHGTFGFFPGEPSAYTQPLYGWFLIPVYWIFGRSWVTIGIAQIVLAVATAFLVYAIGHRLLGPRAGLIGAAIATLNPYLVWHDVHVNREIVDQVVAAALVLLTLMVAERPSKRLAGTLGVVTGLAMLGNTRLALIPVLCAVYLVCRLPRTRETAAVAALVLVGAGIAVAPWLVRNEVSVGCVALTTDGRALWKANNPQTYGLLSSGQWIDNVQKPLPHLRGSYYTPEEAWGYYAKGRPDIAYAHYPDECGQMQFFQHLAIEYMKDHPGQKARLAALSVRLLWQPSAFETTGRAGAGTGLDFGRRIVEPTYMIVLYALAAVGLLLVPRAFAALVLLLFAYQTACAAVFVGATRYRVAWDFLLALLAAAALTRITRFVRERAA
jgi:4-amino-4-deoxy-L-arabinose transferase-like glycosyltransferase